MADPIKSSTQITNNSTLSQVSIKSHFESVCDEIVKKSLESTQYDANRYPEILADLKKTKNVQIDTASLTPPKDLKTDLSIKLEIFLAEPKNPKAPIVVFSHGWGESPDRYRPLLGELATHGYTIVSLTHLSSVVAPADPTLAQAIMLNDKLAVPMANNIQYVVEEIRKGVLKNLGDSNKIIVMGHSLGGAASIMASRSDPAISGCVNLDGFLQGKTEMDGLKQPLLLMIGDYEQFIKELEKNPDKEAQEYAQVNRQNQKKYETLIHNSPHSEKVLIPGAKHVDFEDHPFQDYLAGKKSLPDAMKVHSIVVGKLLEFLKSV